MQSRKKCTSVVRRIALCAGLAGVFACGPSAQEWNELVQNQKQLQEKLERLEQGQARLLAQRQGAMRRERQAEDFDRVYDIPVGDSPIKGNPNAPVTLVEYSDFQCPFCARANPLIKALADKYPEQLRVVYKHFPLTMHPAAKPIAIASMAAQAQGRFWEFHDAVFQNQSKLDPSPDRIEALASEAGLDLERFRRDLAQNAEAYEKRVDAETRTGSQADVRGTPTLYINGKKVQNRSVPGMSAMIDEILREAPAPAASGGASETEATGASG